MARKSKVWILMYYNYDETDFYGVFKTEEAANHYADHLVEASESGFLKRDYFTVEEWEVAS